MIYLKKEIQEQLQVNFHKALNKGGFFVIGKAETLLGMPQIALSLIMQENACI
jgi:chemotaxis methyl-accepting protein methylase